jgi:hypothetical protein
MLLCMPHRGNVPKWNGENRLDSWNIDASKGVRYKLKSVLDCLHNKGAFGRVLGDPRSAPDGIDDRIEPGPCTNVVSIPSQQNVHEK